MSIFFLSSTSAALLLPAFLYARHALSSEFAQLLVILSLVLNLLLPQGGHTLDVANMFRSQNGLDYILRLLVKLVALVATAIHSA